MKIAAWTRNKVAHRDIIEPERITQFSEAHRDTLDCEYRRLELASLQENHDADDRPLRCR